MKNYRMSRNTTEHYTSLSGLREAFGLKPVIKKTKDENIKKTKPCKIQDLVLDSITIKFLHFLKDN